MPAIVSYRAFLIDFPEFEKVDRLLIERKLLSAQRVTPESWGDHRRDGIMLQAAHLISKSPLGQAARLDLEDVETTYEQERHDLEKMLFLGMSKVI